MRPAALMRGARRKPTSMAVERAGCGVDLRFFHERAQAKAHGTAQFGEAQRYEDAILAEQRHGVGDGRDGEQLEE